MWFIPVSVMGLGLAMEPERKLSGLVYMWLKAINYLKILNVKATQVSRLFMIYLHLKRKSFEEIKGSANLIWFNSVNWCYKVTKILSLQGCNDMARLPRLVLPSQPLHIMHRGNNRQNIFENEEDMTRILSDIAESLHKADCHLHAYVIMTNHLHLLLTPKV